MKQLILSAACLFLGLCSEAQTLFTAGNTAVSKDEFLRAFQKNKSQSAQQETALREYLDLYVNFKLKVKAAEERRMDTLTQLVTDLENFKRQVAENYLTDDKALKALQDQTFQRSQQDLRVSMMAVPSNIAAEPADTMKAYLLMQALHKHLASGKSPETFTQGSFRWKDLGYITVFTLPYTYENIVYSLPVGGISQPYRSKGEWRIFTVTGKRPAAGTWRMAQILFSYPPGADPMSRASVKQLADSVHRLLLSGADFSDMARRYSNDKLTYLSGGEMPEFGTGRYDETFESNAFTLKNDNEFTAPFATEFGVHILKRLSFKPTPSDPNDPAFRYELNQKILQDSRATQPRDQFAQSIRQKVGYKKLALVKDADLFRYADSLTVHGEDNYIQKIPFAGKPIISFGKESVNASEWFEFLKSYFSANPLHQGTPRNQLWEKFINGKSLAYYQKNLETYSPEYAYQIREFRDGNLLFEIMEQQVWSKASLDSTGLQAHYQSHKDQYRWAPSAEVIIVNAIHEKAAAETKEALQSGVDWRTLAQANPEAVQLDSGRYELSQILPSGSDSYPGDGAFSAIMRGSDAAVSFFRFLKSYPGGELKSFDQSRGLVINDYQQVVENNWMNTLKKKYPVKINESVYQACVKEVSK